MRLATTEVPASITSMKFPPTHCEQNAALFGMGKSKDLASTPGSTSSKKAKRARAGLCMDRQPTQGYDKSTAISQVESDFTEQADRDLEDPQLLAKYLAKLKIAEAFGQNSRGIQRGFAVKALGKFDDATYKSQLQTHIDLWDHARSLRGGDIESL